MPEVFRALQVLPLSVDKVVLGPDGLMSMAACSSASRGTSSESHVRRQQNVLVLQDSQQVSHSVGFLCNCIVISNEVDRPLLHACQSMDSTVPAYVDGEDASTDLEVIDLCE